MIDFHAHILPGMDHGCTGVAMSIAQLRMAAEHNIDIVIASSHFYPHKENVDSFLRRREEASKRLEIERENHHPTIRLGAEVLICNNIDKMAGIEDLCIEKSRVLLLEMPFIRNWDGNLIDTAVRLREEKGLEVILAHGERYPVKEMEKLLDLGFKLQLNVSSTAQVCPTSFVKRWMKEDRVAAFGSDIHGLNNPYKDFTKSMKKWGTQAIHIMEGIYNLLEER